MTLSFTIAMQAQQIDVIWRPLRSNQTVFVAVVCKARAARSEIGLPLPVTLAQPLPPELPPRVICCQVRLVHMLWGWSTPRSTCSPLCLSPHWWIPLISQTSGSSATPSHLEGSVECVGGRSGEGWGGSRSAPVTHMCTLHTSSCYLRLRPAQTPAELRSTPIVSAATGVVLPSSYKSTLQGDVTYFLSIISHSTLYIHIFTVLLRDVTYFPL